MVSRRAPEPRLEPVALPLSAAGVPVRRAPRRERSPGQGWTRSTSCSTRASSTTTATGSSRSTTRRPIHTIVLMSVRVTNAGPETETLHVLPTGLVPQHVVARRAPPSAPRCALRRPARRDRPSVPRPARAASPTRGPTVSPRRALLRQRDEQRTPLRIPVRDRAPRRTPSTITSSAARRDPAPIRGTKTSFWYRATVDSGRDRLLPGSAPTAAAGAHRPPGAATRRSSQAGFEEADEFYAELTPSSASADEALVLRQAFAGLLWGKQLYYFDVAPWLHGDPELPAPPAARQGGRNARWQTFTSFDIISMPDKWEYPWFAAWDVPFHCIPLARVDPAFAKYQLSLLCRERFQHFERSPARPTNGRSTTSTRPCRPGPRSACSRSTAPGTPTFSPGSSTSWSSTSPGG